MLAALEQWRRTDHLSDRLRYNAALLEVLLTAGALPHNSAAKLTLDDLFARQPENPAYRTSAAFALAKAGRTKEAVALADGLAAGAKALPARAPYLAYVYALDFKLEQAAGCITNAKGGDFLPEETGLIELAQLRVTSPELFKPKPPAKAKR
jgi:predicted Zn-dependent protease